jgi:uncharacterized protein YecE (DUF72 family)
MATHYETISHRLSGPIEKESRVAEGSIRVGVGGWSYEPWRKTFYPRDVPKTRELQYASRQLTTIEINSTFYRLQKPATFAKWRDETPEGFVFTVKGPRYVTVRSALREAGPAIERFIESGVGELGPKLGPMSWQFAPTKRYDAEEIEAFIGLLPREIGGRRVRHALEARHPSFMCTAFLDQLRRHEIAAVFADSDEYPSFADATTDFAYARLMRADAALEAGHSPAALDAYAKLARTWQQGGEPKEIARVGAPGKKTGARDVYLFFINGAKEMAPAAALALISRLSSKDR